MKKGMLVNIYRGDYDSKLNTCYGYKTALLIGDGIPEIFEAGDYPILTLSNKTGRIAAYPLDYKEKWYMFGGTFIYTSDSRFPSEAPIHIHDRYETPEQNKMFSD